MNKPRARIFVAGHAGLVGSAIVRRLRRDGSGELVLRTRRELDLRRQSAVESFFQRERPTHVYLVAGKVGGIKANDTYPAEFIADNLQIEVNVIDAAYRCGTSKLLFLGSSCIYPRLAPQPINEAALLTGPLEPTNEWYAIAKIAGIKLCQAYRRQYGFHAISAMPTNLYGPGDNFDLDTSHVLPALMRKFHEAKIERRRTVEVWGSGAPRREFMHVDDLADAVVYLMEGYDADCPVNIGTGEDIAIGDLASLLARVIGFTGEVIFDRSKPDGTPRKLLDVSRLAGLGWEARIPLEQGLRQAYEWYLEQVAVRTASTGTA